MPATNFAREWAAIQSDEQSGQSWRAKWAITERLRVERIASLNAVVAKLFGATKQEFRRILHECDHPEHLLRRDDYTNRLDPKGFWRVDKEKPPHLRHTVLSVVAFHELERVGLDAFLNMNDGGGWMLPETLRLTDYCLGHDDRAKEHQPVAREFGDRFYDWQLSQSVAESWRECEMHAELLNKIVPPPAPPEKEPGPEEPQASLAF